MATITAKYMTIFVTYHTRQQCASFGPEIVNGEGIACLSLPTQVFFLVASSLPKNVPVRHLQHLLQGLPAIKYTIPFPTLLKCYSQSMILRMQYRT